MNADLQDDTRDNPLELAHVDTGAVDRLEFVGEQRVERFCLQASHGQLDVVIAGATEPASDVCQDFFRWWRSTESSVMLIVATDSRHRTASLPACFAPRGSLDTLVSEGAPPLVVLEHMTGHSRSSPHLMIGIARIDLEHQELELAAEGIDWCLMHSDGSCKYPAADSAEFHRSGTDVASAANVLPLVPGQALIMATLGCSERLDDRSHRLGFHGLVHTLDGLTERPLQTFTASLRELIGRPRTPGSAVDTTLLCVTWNTHWPAQLEGLLSPSAV